MDLRRSRAWINGLSVAALFVALLVSNELVSVVLMLLCSLAALVILYKNLPKLSDVPADSPKIESLKFVTVFTVVYVVFLVGIAVGAEKLAEAGLVRVLSERQMKLVMALLLAVPMAVLGNIAPKLPFNRYTGLRLPWTIRDEETWIVAHRILGYVSLPLAFLLFLNVPTKMDLDTYVKICFLGDLFLWIGIPGILSGVFYYKKWHHRL